MKKQSQVLVEAVIPLIGFYFWDWTFYFVLLFLFIDWIAKEFLIHFQSKKIQSTIGGKSGSSLWKKQGSISGILIFILISASLFLVQLNFKDIDLLSEGKEFAMYKELGLPQFLLFVPLIVLSVYMQYKMEFVKQKLYLKTKLSTLWKEHNINNAGILLVLILGIIVGFSISIREDVLVWSTAICPLAYTWIRPRLTFL